MTATTTVLAQIQLHWKQDAFWYLKIDKKIDEKEKKHCEHTLKTYDYSIVYTATGGFFLVKKHAHHFIIGSSSIYREELSFL